MLPYGFSNFQSQAQLSSSSFTLKSCFSAKDRQVSMPSIIPSYTAVSGSISPPVNFDSVLLQSIFLPLTAAIRQLFIASFSADASLHTNSLAFWVLETWYKSPNWSIEGWWVPTLYSPILCSFCSLSHSKCYLANPKSPITENSPTFGLFTCIAFVSRC